MVAISSYGTLNNMKHTALQTLIAWGNQMLKDNPSNILSFAEAIDKAQELLNMEKEQMFGYTKYRQVIGPYTEDYFTEDFEKYYQENYGKK